MGMDSVVEEFMALQETIPRTIQSTHRTPANEESKANMQINEEIHWRNLYTDPMVKFMDESVQQHNCEDCSKFTILMLRKRIYNKYVQHGKRVARKISMKVKFVRFEFHNKRIDWPWG